MKSRTIRLRVSEGQYQFLKSKPNMSQWILSQLDWRNQVNSKPMYQHPCDPRGFVRDYPPVGSEEEITTVEKVSVVDILNKNLEIDTNRKCSSPGCTSTNTICYMRGSGTFWLCEAHKP